MNKNQKELGIAIIKYSNEGIIIETSFKPTMNIEFKGLELEKLKTDNGLFDKSDLKKATDLVMASWFSKVNSLELMDHSKCQIKSETKICKYYPNTSKIKVCKIRYYVEEV